MTPSSKLHYDVAAAIDMGSRERQEDCLVSDFALGAPIGIAVLADGMGGHNAGEVASAIVVTDIYADLKMGQAEVSKKPGKIPERLRDAVEAANERLLQVMRSNPELRGMGSTVVAGVVVSGSLYWASVGDSLLYLYRDGQLMRLNQDHSMAPRIDAMIAAGQINPEDGASHPDRNCLTSAITGKEIPRIDCPNVPFGIEEGDIVVIASDGLQTLSEDKLKSVLAANIGAPAQKIAEKLVSAVSDERRPKQDNISVSVISVGRLASAELSVPVRSRPRSIPSAVLADASVAAITGADIEEAGDLLNQAIAL